MDQNIKNIINHKADLLSILKPSNAIFGTSSVMMNRKTLNTIYLNAKNKLHKEHIENYCYDNYKKFKIIYPIHDKKYFFPDTNFSIDTLNDYKRVNTIFSNFNLKFGEYNFSKIINYFSKKKIFIGNNYLFKYLSSTYNNRYKFTRSIHDAKIIFDTNISKKNFEKNKIYFLIELNKNSVNINCYQNSILYKLLLVNKFKQFDSNDYIKLFFITLIKRIVFWPPTDADNLQTKSKDKKRLKNIYLNKYNDYLPQRIVTNSKLL